MSSVPSPAAHIGAIPRALSVCSSRSPTSVPTPIQPNSPAAPRASVASAASGDRHTVIASTMMSAVAAPTVNNPIPKLGHGDSTTVLPTCAVWRGHISATSPATAAITNTPTTPRMILSIQDSTRPGPETQEASGGDGAIGTPGNSGHRSKRRPRRGMPSTIPSSTRAPSSASISQFQLHTTFPCTTALSPR